jgi:hypothetical protein
MVAFLHHVYSSPQRPWGFTTVAGDALLLQALPDGSPDKVSEGKVFGDGEVTGDIDLTRAPPSALAPSPFVDYFRRIVSPTQVLMK